jgi:homoserine dehydrogenase
MLGFKRNLESSSFTLMDINEITTKYYMRVKVLDEIGVLANIATILGKYNISIDSFLQKQDKIDTNCATLLFSTHRCKEKDIQNAMIEISKLSTCKDKPVMIRIEN